MLTRNIAAICSGISGHTVKPKSVHTRKIAASVWHKDKTPGFGGEISGGGARVTKIFVHIVFDAGCTQ